MIDLSCLRSHQIVISKLVKSTSTISLKFLFNKYFKLEIKTILSFVSLSPLILVFFFRVKLLSIGLYRTCI